MFVKPSLVGIGRRREDMKIILFSYPFYTNILHSQKTFPSAIGRCAHMKSLARQTFKYESNRTISGRFSSMFAVPKTVWVNSDTERLRQCKKSSAEADHWTNSYCHPFNYTNPMRFSVRCRANNSKFSLLTACFHSNWSCWSQMATMNATFGCRFSFIRFLGPLLSRKFSQAAMRETYRPTSMVYKMTPSDHMSAAFPE